MLLAAEVDVIPVPTDFRSTGGTGKISTRRLHDQATAFAFPSEDYICWTLSSKSPPTQENSVGQIHLTLEPVAAGTLIFELPEPQTGISRQPAQQHLSPGWNNTHGPHRGPRRVYVSTGDPATKHTTSDSIYHANVNSALLMNDAGLTLMASVKVDCRQGQLAELEIILPTDYAIQKVSGPAIAGWNVPRDSADRLRILFQTPIEDKTTIDFTLFRQQILSREQTTIAIPGPGGRRSVS